MKRASLATLSLILVFAFVISLPRLSFAQEEMMEQQKGQMQQQMEEQKGQMQQQMQQKTEEMMGKKGMQDVEGNIICIEVDEKGNPVAKEEYTECKGVFVVVGKDGKVYTVYASEEELKKMPMKAKEKKVSGEVGGHQRAWILYGTPIEAAQKPEEKTVTGTIVCLLPDYSKGTVNPVVASGPCNEQTPHSHVVYTKEGQVYALGGSEEAIHKIEMNPQRTNVTVKGKVQGNQGAWILYAE
jgi:hypothetical protein